MQPSTSDSINTQPNQLSDISDEPITYIEYKLEAEDDSGLRAFVVAAALFGPPIAAMLLTNDLANSWGSAILIWILLVKICAPVVGAACSKPMDGESNMTGFMIASTAAGFFVAWQIVYPMFFSSPSSAETSWVAVFLIWLLLQYFVNLLILLPIYYSIRNG